MTERGQGGLGLGRVEARVEPGNEASLRVATRAGLRREGVRRVAPGTGDRAETTEYVVLARLASDPPPDATRRASARCSTPSSPASARSASCWSATPTARVLLCQLTYKRDWDLPGGVVEVGESPRLAVGREVEEELGLDARPPAALLLTDWLPPWGGWDDAVCLVFDGGVHDPQPSTTDREAGARDPRRASSAPSRRSDERAADFTARRIEAALRSLHGAGRPYTESGR